MDKRLFLYSIYDFFQSTLTSIQTVNTENIEVNTENIEVNTENIDSLLITITEQSETLSSIQLQISSNDGDIMLYRVGWNVLSFSTRITENG
jgi:hypothetical protein